MDKCKCICLKHLCSLCSIVNKILSHVIRKSFGFQFIPITKKCPIISGIRFVDDGILNVLIQEIRMNNYITKYLLMPVCLTKKTTFERVNICFRKMVFRYCIGLDRKTGGH